MAEISTNLTDQYLAENRYSANTERNYRRILELLLAQVETDSLDVIGFRRWLDSHGWSSASKWAAWCAVVGFLRWRHGPDHPALKLKIRRDPSPPQKAYRLPEVQKLLSSFDTSAVKGRRDLALCGVLLDAGLRASEVCRLSLRYVDLGRRTFQVVVKGGQWEAGAFSEYTGAWVATWLLDRAGVAAAGVDALFVSLGGKTPGQPMTPGGLAAEVKGWGQASGIGHLSPHVLRRSMASVASGDMGAPDDVAMKGGRWKSVSAFRRYTVGVKPSDMEKYFPTRAAMESV